jgi:hypothetical protein
MKVYSIDTNTGMPISSPKSDQIGLDVQTVEDVVISQEVIPRPLGDLPPKGTSAIVEPIEILTDNPNTASTTPTTNSVSTTPSTTPTNISTFLGSLTGGGGSGAGVSEDIVEKNNKKPFPYWILVVGAVGAYLIFRKK